MRNWQQKIRLLFFRRMMNLCLMHKFGEDLIRNED